MHLRSTSLLLQNGLIVCVHVNTPKEQCNITDEMSMECTFRVDVVEPHGTKRRTNIIWFKPIMLWIVEDTHEKFPCRIYERSRIGVRIEK